MKKMLPSLIGILLSFSQAEAALKTETPVQPVSAQFALQSEPIDLEGSGSLQTIFIVPKTSDSSIPKDYGIYAETLEFNMDPNHCESDKDGATCTEMGSRTLKAKFAGSHTSLVLFDDQTPKHESEEIKLSNRQTGQPIELSIEMVRVPNDPGKPYVELYLVAKDSTGMRKAKLHPQLRMSR